MKEAGTMIKRFEKVIALAVTVAFMALLPVYSQSQPAGQALNPDKGAAANAEQTQNYVEKELQVGYQASPKRILPVLIGIAAVAAVVFIIVLLVSKKKYDISGEWQFHNVFTTAGHANFDSVWTFTPYDQYNKAMGRYVRNENGSMTQGEFTIVNRSEVVFQDDWMTEQYTGQFDSKTTMSGTFVLANGAEGSWTATKK
jgi:hypothetical protein